MDPLTIFILIALFIWIIFSYDIWKRHKNKFYFYYFLLSIFSALIILWMGLAKIILKEHQLLKINNEIVFAVSILVLIVFVIYNIVEVKDKRR